MSDGNVVCGIGPDRTVRPDPALQSWINHNWGFSLFGEPRFKLIWGPSWFQEILEFHRDYDDNGYIKSEWYGWNKIERYPELGECFHLAKFKETFLMPSPAIWEQQFEGWREGCRVAPIGHRNPRGEYNSIFAFVDGDKTLPPTRAAIEAAIRLHYDHLARIERFKQLSPRQIVKMENDIYEQQMETKKNRYYEKLWGSTPDLFYGPHAVIGNTDHAPHIADRSALCTS